MVGVVVGKFNLDVGRDASVADTCPLRGVPVCGGDFEQRAVRQVKESLDDAFAESGFAKNGGFVIIFERASDDF